MQESYDDDLQKRQIFKSIHIKRVNQSPQKTKMHVGKHFLNDAYANIYKTYLSYCQNRISSQAFSTIKKNTYWLLKWLDKKNIPLDRVTFKECIRYRYYLSRKRKKDGAFLSIGTIHNRLKAGRSLFRYLLEHGICASNPFEELKFPRLPEHLSRNSLNEAQMGNLLNYYKCFKDDKTLRGRLKRYKIHVITELLYATGLRITEAATLLPEHIDTSQRLVYIPEGKGKKARIAFLTKYASEVVQVYLAIGREIVLGKYKRKWGHTLFGTHPERLMSMVNKELKRCCFELGLPVALAAIKSIP